MLDDVRPLAAGGESRSVDVLRFGWFSHEPSRAGAGSDEAFAFQQPDSCDDGATCGTVWFRVDSTRRTGGSTLRGHKGDDALQIVY